MSTFKVKLTQGNKWTGSGNLDENAQKNGVSVQRTMWVTGPKLMYRKMHDGEVFTDCNYWKRFAYPNVPFNEAFIEVVEDDGSVYIDGQRSTFIRTYNLVVNAGSTFEDNVVDVIGDNGGPAQFSTITVTGNDVRVRVNGLTTSDFVVVAGTSHTYNTGDTLISEFAFDNSLVDPENATVEVQVGVFSNCKS